MSKRNKSAAGIFAGALILIFAGVISYVALIVENNTIVENNINQQTQLAEVGKTGFGLPVKVEKLAGYPLVTVTPFSAGESSAPPSSCYDKKLIDRYFGGSNEAYNRSLIPDARCTSGYMQASSLNDEMRDDNVSISEIDKMINAVSVTLDVLNKSQSIDGLSLYVIPGGLDTTPLIPFAENIVMKCVRKSSGNGYEQSPAIAVGTKAEAHSVLFDNAPPSLIDELAKMRKSNAETNAKIEPKLASADINLTAGENFTLANTALSLHSALGGKHIGVTQEILNRSYSTLVQAKVPLHFQAYLARDKGGNTINCNSSVSGPLKFLASQFGLGGDYFRVNLNIGELGYTKVCIPDASLLTLIKNDMQKHITRLQKLRAAHEAKRAGLEIRRQKLADKNYYCPS